MNYLNEIEDKIKGLGFEIIEKDFERPWGGFSPLKTVKTCNGEKEYFCATRKIISTNPRHFAAALQQLDFKSFSNNV